MECLAQAHFMEDQPLVQTYQPLVKSKSSLMDSNLIISSEGKYREAALTVTTNKPTIQILQMVLTPRATFRTM